MSYEEAAIFAYHLFLQDDSDRKETAVFVIRNLSAGFVNSQQWNRWLMKMFDD